MKDKWLAVAAQTARCLSKVQPIPYVYYFTAYQRQWNGWHRRGPWRPTAG